MSENKKDFQRVNSSDQPLKEPSLPVFIPMRIVRWLAYSGLMCLLLMPALWDRDIRISISVSLILGHFASQLNALINKKL